MTGPGPRTARRLVRRGAATACPAALFLATLFPATLFLAVLLLAGGPGRGTRTARAEDAAPAPLRVRDAGGRVPPGAVVVEVRTLPAERAGAPGLAVVDEEGPTVAVADAEGQVTPAPLPRMPGAALVVRRPGSALAPVVPGRDVVVLDDGAALAGVLRCPDGSPVAGFTVYAYPADAAAGPWVRCATVRADGSSRFATLAPSSRFRLVGRRGDGAWLDLGDAVAGSTLPPTVVPNGATVRGRVLDAEGRGPVRGLRLRWRALAPRARWADGEPAADGSATRPGAGAAVEDAAPPDVPAPDVGALAETVTGEDGRFVVADLPARRYEVEGLDADLLWDGEAPRVDVATVGAVRLETWWVRRRGAIVGAVEDGKTHLPVVGARVRAVPAPDTPDVPGGLGPSAPVRTDGAGRFRIAGLAPAPGWRLVVEAEGRSSVLVGPVDVAGGRDEPAGLVRLVRAWMLDVRVVDATGAGVVGARVTANPSSRPADAADGGVRGAFVRVGTTDVEGHVRLEDLAEGDHQVAAEGAGIVPSTVIVPEAAPGSARSARVEVARTVAVEGRVDAVDGPLPPVRVRAVVRDSAAFGTEEVVRGATPDRTGRFRLDDLPPTPVDVEATSPDGAYLYARREAYVPGSGDALVLPVPAARGVAGTVGNLARGGARATVRLEALRYDPLREEHRPVLVAQTSVPTDGDHAPFAFEGVAPGTYAVRALQGGRDSGPLPVTVDGRGVDGLELRLPSPATVEGLVADARFDAAAFGATVRLVRLQGGGPAPSIPPRAATTDAYGHFAFDDVAPGLWRVEVFDRDAVGTETEVRVMEGERVALLDLRLGTGGRIEGVVADERARAVGGLPLRVLRLPDLEELPPIVTRADGGFRSGPLAAGRYRLRVAAGLAERPGIEADIEVVEGETTVVDFARVGGSRIDGAVRRRGSPVPGIGVEAVADVTRGCDEVVLKTVTDAHGEYHWDGLAEGRYLLRLVDGAVRSGVPVRLGRNDRVTRDLELGEGGIRGFVRLAKGDPVAGAEVVAVPLAPTGTELASGTSGRVRTRPDGRFELFGLPVARYRLHVTPLDRPTRTVPDVVAEPAGQEGEVEVVLGIGGRLELRLHDDRGRPVMAAEVWVETPAGVALHPRPYYTQPSGRLDVDGLPEGPARVRVHARGYGRPSPAPVTIREGLAAPLELTVRPACTLRVTVAAGRDPLPRARVEVRRASTGELVLPRRALRRPEDTSGFGVTPRTGVLVLDDLEEGGYRVTVDGGSTWAPATVPATVAPGRTTDVGVTLLPR